MTVMCFSHRFPPTCIWEFCMLMVMFRSPGLCFTGVITYKDQDLPQKNTHVITLPFEALQKELCVFHLFPGLSFLSQGATQWFSKVATVHASSLPSLPMVR